MAPCCHTTLQVQGKEIQLPDDGLRTETCRSSFSVLMCKFYISALVGIIIECLDNMHGVTMEIQQYHFLIHKPKPEPCTST